MVVVIGGGKWWWCVTVVSGGERWWVVVGVWWVVVGGPWRPRETAEASSRAQILAPLGNLVLVPNRQDL